MSAARNVLDDNYIKLGDKTFYAEKDSKRTWAEHYLYMVAVSGPRGDGWSLVPPGVYLLVVVPLSRAAKVVS